MSTAVTPLSPLDVERSVCCGGLVWRIWGNAVDPMLEGQARCYTCLKPCEVTMTPDQLSEWERVKLARKKRLKQASRFVSLCCRSTVWSVSKENVIDPTLAGKPCCETCGRLCSVIVRSEQACDRPIQEPFLVLPEPATPYRWAVESRWKPEIWKQLNPAAEPGYILPDDNAWTPVRGYEKLTTERQAVNEVRRRRRLYPGKQFRTTVVEWSRHGDAFIYSGTPERQTV